MLSQKFASPFYSVLLLVPSPFRQTSSPVPTPMTTTQLRHCQAYDSLSPHQHVPSDPIRSFMLLLLHPTPQSSLIPFSPHTDSRNRPNRFWSPTIRVQRPQHVADPGHSPSVILLCSRAASFSSKPHRGPSSLKSHLPNQPAPHQQPILFNFFSISHFSIQPPLTNTFP